MASFDVSKAAATGYSLAWKERHYLVRLAAVPFLIRLVCYIAVLQLGWAENFLRQAIIMLPAYFAMGWMLSHLSRMVLLDQRWPFRPTGDTDRDMATLQDRALGVMKGTLTFAVSRFLLDGVLALLTIISAQGLAQAETQTVNPGMFMLVVFLSFFLFWGFRLLWAFIPAAVNYPLLRYMGELRGFGSSLYLIGAWLLAFVPPFIVCGMLLSFLSALLHSMAGTAGIIFAANVLKMLLDMVVHIVATVAIADAIRQVMSRTR